MVEEFKAKKYFGKSLHAFFKKIEKTEDALVLANPSLAAGHYQSVIVKTSQGWTGAWHGGDNRTHYVAIDPNKVHDATKIDVAEGCKKITEEEFYGGLSKETAEHLRKFVDEKLPVRRQLGLNR